VSRSSM